MWSCRCLVASLFSIITRLGTIIVLMRDDGRNLLKECAGDWFGYTDLAIPSNALYRQAAAEPRHFMRAHSHRNTAKREVQSARFNPGRNECVE